MSAAGGGANACCSSHTVQLHKFRQKFMFHSETAQQCQQFDDHLTPIENRQEGDREADAA